MPTTSKILEAMIAGKANIKATGDHMGPDAVMHAKVKGHGTSPKKLREAMKEEQDKIRLIAERNEWQFSSMAGKKIDNNSVKINEYGEIERGLSV